MLHRIWAGGIAITLSALSVGVSLPGRAASSPRASASSGVAVATGTVTNPRGKVMPGVAVGLYAWPPDVVLAAMKPGALVPTKLLAAATTDAVGRYTLRVPAGKLRAATVAAGYANLEISSPAGIWFFAYPARPQPARPSAPVTVNLGRKPKWVCGYNSVGQPYGLSAFRLLRHRKPAQAVVGQGYIAGPRRIAGDHVFFDYNQGSSHTQASALGVGLSGYGIQAGYSSDGTHMSTVNRSQSWPSQYHSTLFRTEFKTEQLRAECYGPPFVKVPRKRQRGACPSKYEDSYVHMCLWLIQSAGWFGGESSLHPRQAPRTRAYDCASYPKNGIFDSDFGTAIKWSTGFDLGAALEVKGVNLKASFNGSAQTGYDVNAYMTFHFGHAGYLCGTNGPPSTAALLVQRGSKS